MSNMVVRTNVMSLNSHRNLGMTGNTQARASQRLSSGFRINSAADDAAGLAISEKMRAQIRGLDQASRNAQDGISFIQTAEGALSTVNDMLIRVRELVNQAANDTNTGYGATGGSDRAQIAREIYEIQSEISDLATRVQFNTINIFDGSLGGADGRIGRLTLDSVFIGNAIGNGDDLVLGDIEITRDILNATGFESDTEAGDLGAVIRFMEVANRLGADRIRMLIGDPDGSDISDRLDVTHADFNQELFDILLDFVRLVGTGEDDPGGLFMDDEIDSDNILDAMEQIANLFSDTGLFGAIAANNASVGGSMWFQVGANSDQGLSIDIDVDLTVIAAGLSNTFTTIEGASNFDGDVITHLLDEIDNLLEETNNQRAQLGAWQNRLEFTIENLDISSENLQAANSRIRDADMAREMMTMTQMNVLQQAAISMLSQANQAPQSILQLLR